MTIDAARCHNLLNDFKLDQLSKQFQVETLRAPEDALLEFAGYVTMISHDRWFLDLQGQLSGIRSGQAQALGRRRRKAETDSV